MKDRDWEWKDKEQEAFEKLKETMQTTPVLVLLDPEKNHRVEIDCLDFARRVVLLQKEEEEWHSVAFLSKKLNKYEVNYFTYEKELFGLIEALRTWRYLLLGKYFKVFTDYRIIINLMKQKNLKERQVR
jgi:RNase H-like domain found in reverse transcriptase